MTELNYHHLRYFWAIAHEQSLTRAAARLLVSQSALSIQLKQLEQRLGHALFERRGRKLLLTEAGRIALDHADTIFRAGDELLSTLQGRPSAALPILRIGSVSTLSRNFQMAFLQPLIEGRQAQVRFSSGGLRELLPQLTAHTLDLVLSNEAVPRDRAAGWQSVLLAQQQLSLVSRPGVGESTGLPAGDVRSGSPSLRQTAPQNARSAPSRRPPKGKRPAPMKRHAFRFPEDLDGQEVLLPSESSSLRASFDVLLSQSNVRPIVLAEVDDMAMLRVLARQTGALALVPPVVVRDELAAGTLIERCTIPTITERFYAITTDRRFPHPLLKDLLSRSIEPFAGPH